MAQQLKTPLAQPNNIFFDVAYGNLQTIQRNAQNVGPNIAQTFRFSVGWGGIGNFSLNLCDITGESVLPYLFGAPTGQGTVQFGYNDSTLPLSETASFKLPFYFNKVVPKFGPGNSMSLLVGGNTLAPLVAQTGQITGTFDSITQQLSDKYTKAYPNVITAVVVNPPISTQFMLDNGLYNKDSTSPQEMQFCKLMSETDWSYLCRIAKSARSTEGYTGYHVFPVYVADNQVEIHIEIPGYPGSVNQTVYTWSYPSREGNVIDWIPDVDFSCTLGGGYVQHNSNHSISGIQLKNDLNSTSTQQSDPYQQYKNGPPPVPPSLIGAVNANNVSLNNTNNSNQQNSSMIHPSQWTGTFSNPPSVTNGAVRSRHHRAHTGQGELNEDLWEFNYGMLQAWSGTLIVLGDATIQAGLQVDLSTYLPKSYDPDSTDGTQPHFTTGRYLVSNAEHIIDSSGYKTIMRMHMISPPSIAAFSK